MGKRDFWQGNYFFWGATSGNWNSNGDESGQSGNNIEDGGMWLSTALVPHIDYFRDADTWSVKNGYQSENLDSYYPKIYFDGDNGKNRKVQTRYLQDASYIRLKNLQIGYTLPQTLTKKVKIEKLRIFFSGENLWTASNMISIFDPETIDGGFVSPDFSYHFPIKNYNRHWDIFPLYHYDVNNDPYVYSEQAGGNVHEEYQKDNLLGLNLYTEYSLTVKEKNNFKAMIGFQEQQMSQLKFGLQRNGIIYPSLPEVDLTNGLDFKGNPV
ncbi:TonB-dependent receptor SusC, partial [termite gut metagenome]